MAAGTDAFPVNNSAYTNAAATIALSFATEAAGVLGKTADAHWAEVAAGLKLAVSPTVPNHPELQVNPPLLSVRSRPRLIAFSPCLQGGYHPEYKGFPKNPAHPKVKQADTIMLSYPLGVEMSDNLLKNDLTFCTPQHPAGPAVTLCHLSICRRLGQVV